MAYNGEDDEDVPDDRGEDEAAEGDDDQNCFPAQTNIAVTKTWTFLEVWLAASSSNSC